MCALSFSMDDEQIYGPTCHRLSFGEAAKRDIICNYKVIISVVTSDSLNRELLQRGEVVVQGDSVKAHRVANILALTNAIERYNIKRIFTFHNSVKAAQSFTSDTSEGVASFIKDFNTFHVNGEMSTSKRELVMRDFRNSTKAIMSNARCLTEGVDVPAVDMVAFISPKKSRVDIVQAAGRAMRKSPDKEFGYILMPIFLEVTQDETIEQALEKTQYDDIWQVLQALQEHDESLVEIIGQMRQEIGRTGSCNDSQLRDKVEIHAPEIYLTMLRNTITTKIVEKLGSTWNERFGELCRFKEMNGHCNVPENYIHNIRLAIWVGNQRADYRKNKLLQNRYNLLNLLGFDWNPIDILWEKKYSIFYQFWLKNRHCKLPVDDPLYPWAQSQRQLLKKNKLTLQQINKLENIGFDWEPINTYYAEMFLALCDFKKNHGHCSVPNRYLANQQLATWVGVQRHLYKNNKLSLDRVQQLVEIGFDWDPNTTAWERMLGILCEFKQKHGHCNVPERYPENSLLGQWVGRQREKNIKGLLGPEYKDRLNELGFDWDPANTYFEEMLVALRDFKIVYGHCMVPHRYLKNPALGAWVQNLRFAYKKNKLGLEKINKLEEMGFIWNHQNVMWEKRYFDLYRFQQMNGHCNVPRNFMDRQLEYWVGTQRVLYKEDKLAACQIKKLEDIGFLWDCIESKWQEKYSELSEYKKNYGHFNVPKIDPKHKQLNTWIAAQRKLYKTKRLDLQKEHLLDNIGFIWDPIGLEREEKFSELLIFVQENGNCNVPGGYTKNPSLAAWLQSQRQLYKKNQLPAEQIKRLEGMGIHWDPFEVQWNEHFEALLLYREENGHSNVPKRYAANPSLGLWVQRQRLKYKKNQLEKLRIDKLNAIGFAWQRHD